MMHKKFGSAVRVLVLCGTVLGGAACSDDDESDDKADAKPEAVEMTWFSIANWYFKFGDTKILMDAYMTRVPASNFHGGGGGLAETDVAWPIDEAMIDRTYAALLENDSVDYIVAGHSHFDHTYDTATWAMKTGAREYGGISTCYQAQAQGLATDRCTSVKGGETITFDDNVKARVVRWNHSGNNTTNPEQHLPVELAGPPTPDANGNFRAGVAEDYPNGGGGRMYLFTVDTKTGPVTFYVNNSASAVDLTVPIVVDGVDYGAPLANLQAAMADAGLTSVDVWIGTGGKDVAELVVPVLHPKVYIPNHWDGLYAPFENGLPAPYSDPTLKAYLDAQGIPIMAQNQYFDGYTVSTTGVTTNLNHDMKARFGFPDVQTFPAETLSAAATKRTVQEDCY